MLSIFPLVMKPVRDTISIFQPTFPYREISRLLLKPLLTALNLPLGTTSLFTVRLSCSKLSHSWSKNKIKLWSIKKSIPALRIVNGISEGGGVKSRFFEG